MHLKPSHLVSVFISHSSSDLEFSRCLATDLKEIAYDVFLDDWSIELGENIVEKINTGLEASKVLIPVISKDFLSSVFCKDEWTSFYMRFAKSKQDAIMPVIIDDVDVPAILASRKYYKLWVNPKFCVNPFWGANRAKFIRGGSRLVRRPPYQQNNA